MPIGEWVFDRACQQLADWRARGIDVGRMAVNLSAVQLLESGLRPALRGSLARHAIPGALLELELTETTSLRLRIG